MGISKATLRRQVLGGALGALLVVATACGSSSPSSTSGKSSGPSAAVLGTKARATGEPVKVGFVSDGRSPGIDWTIETKVAPAVVSYVNDYRSGIAGRPIKLFSCVTNGDPGKGSDCGTEMVRNDVVAVLVGSSQVSPAIWKPVHDAQIPLMTISASAPEMLTDRQGTFMLADPLAALVDQPAAVAKQKGVTKVTGIVIDVPAATAFAKTLQPTMFQKLGLKFDYVAIPPDQADVTPQMQRLTADNPGVLSLVGGEAFCTATLNGLRAVNFKGPITMTSYCLGDSLRKAVPGDFLEGIALNATSPIGSSDPDLKLYDAIMDTYAKGQVDLGATGGANVFTTVMAFVNALEGLSGEITPATVTSKIKAMPEKPLPLGGGVKYRCNGKASSLLAAVCTRGTLSTTLDKRARPTTYEVIGSTPIED